MTERKEPVKPKDKKDLDLSQPIDKSKSYYSNVPCFGQLWDLVSRECMVCAANEVCAVFMQENVKKKADDFEKKEGYFLDTTDFYGVDSKMLTWLEKNRGEEITSLDLVEAVKRLAKCRDESACVLFVKRLIKNTDWLSIKGGFVQWLN